MEDKYLYPIIGIALGWFLKELSTAFQSSQESKRRLGRAISSLAYLNQEMILIQGHFEVFKDLSDSHQEFERFRQYILRKYPRRDEAYVEQIKESIATVAELSPLTALNLHGIINRYWFLQEAKLTEASKDYELYIYQLSSLEVGFELYQKEMEKVLRKLAFKHGIRTWAQVLYESRRMRKNRLDKTESFGQLLKQFKDAKDKYSQGNTLHNKANSADAEKQRR